MIIPTVSSSSHQSTNQNINSNHQGVANVVSKQLIDLNDLLNGGNQLDQQQSNELNSPFPFHSSISAPGSAVSSQHHQEPPFSSSSLDSLSRPGTAPPILHVSNDENNLKRSSSAAGFEHEFGDAFDDDDEETATLNQFGKKNIGRRKIKIEYIEDKSRRHITFSKRKAGIMKKAYELATLTGTQVLLLVASETGHVYTFATPKLQPLITEPEGKSMIQSCLNSTVNATSDAANLGTGSRAGTPVNYPEQIPPSSMPLSSISIRYNEGGSPSISRSLPSLSLQQHQQSQQQLQTQAQKQQQQHEDQFLTSLSSYNNNINQQQHQLQYNQTSSQGYTSASYSTAGLPLSPRSQVYGHMYAHPPSTHSSNTTYNMKGCTFSQNNSLNPIMRAKSPTQLMHSQVNQNDHDLKFNTK